MTARSRRRRERAARVEPSARPPRRRLPLLPLVAAGAGAALLGTAWTTTWAPGPGRAAEAQNRFTIEIPEPQQATINSWERFFICYDLLDPAIVDLTLRAHQRTSGTLDFPAGGRVEVALPLAESDGNAAAAAGSGEDDLIAARRAVLGSAVPARMAEVRRQCAAAAPAT